MNPPANWYPDPTGRHGQRYWDGAQWTEHVFTDGVQDVDPLEQAAATAEVSGDEATADPAPTDEDADEVAADDQPAGAPADDDAPAAGSAEGSGAEAANGLFDEAGGQEAWTPQDQESEAGAAVAPDMETEDVVASLDEVADGSPDEDSSADDNPDVPPATGDMSDAFILAPETASRIVKRRAAALADAEQPVEPTEPAASSPRADEDVAADAGAGAIDAPPPAAGVPLADAPPPTDAPLADAPPPADASSADEDAPSADEDAPPGWTAEAPGTGGLGITGDLLDPPDTEPSGPVALQNSRLLRCSLPAEDAVIARRGTMVAHQGDVSFEEQDGDGEGPAMLRAEGTGDVFFADGAQHVVLLELAGGPGLSVNGRNVLAFSGALEWHTQRVDGASLPTGDLFNTTFTGTGWVALVSDGEPVVLHTDEAPTHVDVTALVAWSAALSPRVGSGEAVQMAFDGPGIVIVQPSAGRRRDAEAN